MATVTFKKGLLANLPAAHTAGAFYVTTDERAIYLDVSDTERIRVGDFQEFATLAALKANTNPSTSALYYVTELNCLAKWDGSDYTQINVDTGATSFEVTGEGNAITGVTYNPATRKATFTRGTFATPSEVDTKIETKVGDLGEKSVKEYVDEKTSGVVTDASLSALTGRVTTAEGKIDKLNGDKTTEGSVAKAIADLQGDTESTVADVDARVCTIEDNYVDNYDVSTAIAGAIGTNPDNKTVAELIAAAKSEATYDDTELAGKVDTLVGTDTGKSARTIANEELAKQLIPENAGESLDTLAEIAAWIQSHPNDASAMNQAITALQTKVTLGTHEVDGDQVEYATVKAYVEAAIAALNIGDYATAANLTALAGRVTTLEGDTHTHTNKALLDTYTQTEANLADAVLRKHSHANNLELDKIAIGDKDKWDAAEAKAHEHANATVLDGITADEVTAWNAAEQNAKDYADGLLEWGSF